MPKCNLCKLNTYVLNISYCPPIKATVVRSNTVLFKLDVFGRLEPRIKFKSYSICYSCIDTIKNLKVNDLQEKIDECNQLQKGVTC